MIFFEKKINIQVRIHINSQNTHIRTCTFTHADFRMHMYQYTLTSSLYTCGPQDVHVPRHSIPIHTTLLSIHMQTSGCTCTKALYMNTHCPPLYTHADLRMHMCQGTLYQYTLPSSLYTCGPQCRGVHREEVSVHWYMCILRSACVNARVRI